jgi:hypothetical protein
MLLRAADCSIKVQGKVQLMDPEVGMGIEFLIRTPEQRERLQQLIQQMTASPDLISEVLVEPEGMDWEQASASGTTTATAISEAPKEEADHDPLLELFRAGASLTKSQLLVELQKYQLGSVSAEGLELNLSEPFAYQRREPRLAVSLPVQVVAHSAEITNEKEPAEKAMHLIDVSHRGARVSGVAIQLKPGGVVNLVSDGCDARFLITWVGEPNTPQEGQIGLQSLATD